MESSISLEYERGEGRNKHRWNKDEAGFVPSQKGAVGKCPNSITEEIAEQILKNGIPYYEQVEDEYPSKIYSVYNGVIYEAVPTIPKKSWHGYPWRGDLPGRNSLSRKMKKQLKEIAAKENYLKEYEQWLKQYG